MHALYRFPKQAPFERGVICVPPKWSCHPSRATIINRPSCRPHHIKCPLVSHKLLLMFHFVCASFRSPFCCRIICLLFVTTITTPCVVPKWSCHPFEATNWVTRWYRPTRTVLASRSETVASKKYHNR